MWLALSILGCDLSGPEAPAPVAAPAPANDPEPAERAGRGHRGKRGGSTDGCPPGKVAFQTTSGTVTGLREVVKALDPMTHGEDTDYALTPGTVLPCAVDLRPVAFHDDAIDRVIATADGRGLLFSAGTGSIRGIQILDLDTGRVWSGSALTAPEADGDGIVVRNLGEALPPDQWPADCDPKLKGQMGCTAWTEIRWSEGTATPTGKSGGVITE
ncbi:MAG: hypothetical protein ABMB14_39195 [Myxococcota bacterium]